ncbi:MAG: hypothetical protein J6B40_08205 [Oscillospiraceae bacterium]|nr:hypothetical protein [Oscillospiraceae bacterium]MBQ9108637.1 hypothetical protein [Oscillospiraceae bacterium]
MKGRVLVTMGAVAACAVLGIAAANYDLRQTQTQAVLQEAQGIPKAGQTAQEPDLPAVSGQTEPAQPILQENNSPVYRLGTSQGRLAVFVEGSDEPEMVLDVYLSTLPEVDRLLLEQGIEAQSYAQLVSMIEDYIS